MPVQSLFKQKKHIPLAHRMRPRFLSEMIGQKNLLGTQGMLYRAVKEHRLSSMILWGPPGCGKTTLAKLMAYEIGAHFQTMSATTDGVVDLRKAIKKSEEQQVSGRSSILFIDEIHRFNKAQQDVLLPHVESGAVVLIGATTENPSFAVIGALLSRVCVYQLKPLSTGEIVQVLERAVVEVQGSKRDLKMRFLPEALEAMAQSSDGDARKALNTLETVAVYAGANDHEYVDVAMLQQVDTSKTLLHDKKGEAHYNVVSAFIKSMRGSDPDAALYWMIRMLEAGEDPRFVMRRMIIFASEDIGNAEPHALSLAMASDAAFQRLGMPEGIYPLSHCCLYLASCPKSNAVTTAWMKAKKDVVAYAALPVPLKLCNGVTMSMRSWGYGKGYRYPHDEGGYAVGEVYFPKKLKGQTYYLPTDFGYEANIKAFLARLREKDNARG